MQLINGLQASKSTLLKVNNLRADNPKNFWVLVDIDSNALASCRLGDKFISVRARLIGDSNEIKRSIPEVTRISAKVDDYHQAVWINDGIFVDHVRGQRLGTYCINALVTWIIENVPAHYAVKFPRLGGDLDAVNIDRRNRLYRHFGFDFVWETINGLDKAGGIAKPCTVADLIPYQNWPNIMKYDLPDGLVDLVSENQQLTQQCLDQTHRIKHLTTNARQRDDSMFSLIQHIEWLSIIVAFVLGVALGHWW